MLGSMFTDMQIAQWHFSNPAIVSVALGSLATSNLEPWINHLLFLVFFSWVFLLHSVAIGHNKIHPFFFFFFSLVVFYFGHKLAHGWITMKLKVAVVLSLQLLVRALDNLYLLLIEERKKKQKQNARGTAYIPKAWKERVDNNRRNLLTMMNSF